MKIGVLAFRPKPQTLAQWQPLAAALKQAIPERDFVIEVFDYPELDMAIATRQLDFVLTNPGHYVLLTKRNGLSAPLATLAKYEQGKVATVFGGVIFSRAGQTKINSLADLRGKTIAAVGTEAMSGYQAQAYELKRLGIQLPQDAKLLITGVPHDNVVDAVLTGRADAGFVRTGVLEDMAREGKLDMARIKVLNRQNLPGFPVQISTHLYPEWPFAALPHIDENLSRHVVAALFRLEENSAATKAMGIHGFVIPADYTPVSDMLRELRLPPFDTVPGFTLHDVWHQYRGWIIALQVAVGLILLLGIRLLANNRKLNAERRITLLQNQQLDESERRYHFLFNNNPLPMWVFAEDSLRFLEVNERALKHYGFTREEFGRMTLRDIRPAEDVPELNRVISSSPDGKILAETRHKKKDGALIDVVISTMPMKYGATTARIVLIQDITERKRVEEELKLSAQLLNSTSDTVFLLDPDGNFVYLNEAAWKSRGYTRDEMMGMNLRELNAPEYNKLLASRIKALLENGQGFFESAHRCKDGTVMPVEINVRIIESGGRKLMLSVIRDITERKLAEARLLKSEASLRAILDNMPYLSWLKDTTGHYMAANEKFLEMLGEKRAQDVLGKTDLDLWPKELAEKYRADDAEVMASRQQKYIEESALDGDKTYWVETFKTPVIDESGNVLGTTGFARDITERREHEEELKRSNIELEQFSYAVSHDMRQPLRVISSYLQLLEMGLADQLDGEKRDYFNFAIDGAKRIDQMLVALLEYSRVGKMGEPPTWVESRAVLDEALQFLQPAIIEAQAKLNISGDWPRIFASHDEILRLLQNLVGNAVKFRVAGRLPEITVTGETVKNEWHLCVADNGVGIIPDQVKRLFQVFQRLQLRTAYEGNGVGLALCRKIAEHHKGRIWAESAGEGQGSRFCVVLPVPQKVA